LESVEGKVCRGQVCGSSMAPTLRRGDRITVMPVDKYRLGEIILFAWHGKYIIHRVMAILPGRLITKGDASPRLDPAVFTRNILGKAVIRERNGKVEVLDSCEARWRGLILGLGALVLYPVLDSLRSLVGYWQKRQQASLR